ncbi:MAG: secretin and TonB N-terminal domain-containing protein [Candidatus Omnitrophica bacterium]|nr:secretin and TonB N-terminal domain-containing protein [Candidatus Omnitrophota bacterium]
MMKKTLLSLMIKTTIRGILVFCLGIIALDSVKAEPSVRSFAEGEAPSLIQPVQKQNATTKVEKIDIPESAMIDLLELKDMNTLDVLDLISKKTGLNIIAGNDVKGKVSIYLRNVKLKDALKIVLDANGLAYKFEDNIIRVMPAAEFEMRYGYKFGGDIETRVIHLLHTNVEDIAIFANQMKSPTGKVVTNPQTNTLVITDSSQSLENLQKLIQQVDVPVETKVFALSYSRATDITEKIRPTLTNNIGHVRTDERSNKIIVTDTLTKLREIASIIEAFDVKEKEVLIEAKIVQIVLSDQYKFGVDWEAVVSDYHKVDLKNDLDILSSADKGGKLSVGTVSDDDYNVLLEALETVGATNILSSPTITAMNNQEAKILVGSTEPYVTTTTTTPSSGPATTAESVNFIDVGVKLFVTPTIHMDDFITMKINPEVSSVIKKVITSNNNTIPVIETSEAETKVMVKDGVTIVIGGLIKEERIESKNKVPVLGDIPLLGHAFRNSDELVRKTEIVIFLTPKIISGDIPVAKNEKVLGALRP